MYFRYNNLRKINVIIHYFLETAISQVTSLRRECFKFYLWIKFWCLFVKNLYKVLYHLNLPQLEGRDVLDKLNGLF